jgi:3'(2'), 5'-bisphosphate nucleotidase
MDDLLENLLAIAREAAREVMDVYHRPFHVDFKGPEDPVTEADRRANDLICKRLEQMDPGTPVVAEESPEADFANFRAKRRVYFVDPVDGTREFVAKGTQFVVMIGLLDGDRPSHGVLVSPTDGTAWIGATGLGAYRIEASGETRRIQVAEPAELSRTTVVSSRSHQTSLLERAIACIGPEEVLPIGSAGLKGGMIAEGRGHIYLAPEHAGCRWDSCAPEAIIAAAGGVYTDAHGAALDYRHPSLRNSAGIVAAGPRLHGLAVEAIRSIW